VTKIYDIGPFRLDAEAGVLTEAGVPVALGRRAVAVLVTLVERSNEYVQKDAIIDKDESQCDRRVTRICDVKLEHMLRAASHRPAR
jgi:DNA-binding winged helix-turn-helix (wHTH) protein